MALAVIVGGCTSSGSGGITPLGTATTNRTASSSSTAPGTTTTTIDATRAVIVAAYRQDENVYLEVVGHYPIVPLDPRLPEVMTGNQLKAVQTRLTAAALQGQYATGTIDLAPVVTAVNGTTATITDCSFDHTRIINGTTQQTITTGDTKRALEKITMVLETGTWKISDDQTVGSGCVPGA